jgi:hypothetical protein
MLLQRKGLLSWLGVFRRHPGFQRPREQQRTVPECATRRICGSAKGHGFICVAKGHDFSRAVKRSQFDTFGASAPEASAAKAGERQIIRRGCGTTPDGNHRDRFRRALSQVAARPSRRAPAPACRGPVPMLFIGMRHPAGGTWGLRRLGPPRKSRRSGERDLRYLLLEEGRSESGFLPVKCRSARLPPDPQRGMACVATENKGARKSLDSAAPFIDALPTRFSAQT